MYKKGGKEKWGSDLAGRQHHFGRNMGILEQLEGHKLVILCGFGILQNVGELLQVPRPQKMRNVHLAMEQGKGKVGVKLQTRGLGRYSMPWSSSGHTTLASQRSSVRFRA